LTLGHEGTVEDFIQSLQGKDGVDGKSAYEIWIEEGHEGTVTDFLNSLVGKSAYEIWLSLGHEGSEEDFIASLKGETGKSAYEVWLEINKCGKRLIPMKNHWKSEIESRFV